MENIKRIAQQKEKRRKEKEALRQQEILQKSKVVEQETQSERIRKFSTQSYESNPYRKSISLKITDLDTSQTTELEEEDLESFTSKLRFDTLGHIEVSEQFLTAKTSKELMIEAFALACEKGDIQAMNSVLSENKVDVNVELEDGRNCLHLVISSYRMSLKAISLLLLYRIDVNKPNKMGRTPLIIASLKSNVQICKLLIEKDCDLNVQDMYGNTALHYACIHGWQLVATLLLQNKAKVDLKNKNQEIPEQCCKSGQVMKLFNTKYQYTRTVFDDYILKNGKGEVSQKLLERNQEETLPVNVSQSTEASSETGRGEMKWRDKLKKYQNLLKTESEMESTQQSFSKVSLLDFKCIDLIGKGSFGQVYLVEHEQTKQLYAMKVLSKTQIKANKLLPYVQMEKKILSMVKNPFIVGLHYSFQTHDKLILIMTYCPGGDLLQLTRKSKRLPEEQIKMYAAEIVVGLECLHKAEIIYRDLKPANVVLDKDGHACITDFGLAKESEIGHSFCGSMAYLAPEMLARRGHTRRIDWYLLGVLIYECYTGKPPFWDVSKDKLILNIKSGIYTPFEASAEMKDIVSKLLTGNPSKRLGGTHDAQEVKAHPWFKGIDWKSVQARRLQVPPITNPLKINEISQRKSLFTEEDVEKGMYIDRLQGWEYSIQ